MQKDPVSIASKSYQAHVNNDRDAIEAVVADDFHFTSPNRIDRETYFKRRWPNVETIAAFDFIE